MDLAYATPKKVEPDALDVVDTFLTSLSAKIARVLGQLDQPHQAAR